MSKPKPNPAPDRKGKKAKKAKSACAKVVPITAAKSAKKRKQPARGGHHNRGLTFPPDPPTNEEIMRILKVGCAPRVPGPTAKIVSARLRALIILLWRTGLRISEALDLEERDLNPSEMAVLVRKGKGGKRRLVLMDSYGWSELDKWLKIRRDFPSGKLFCAVQADAAGRALWSSDVRRQFREAQNIAGVRRRFAPHQLRHKLACDLRREGVDFDAIQAQLGHARLDVTQQYLRSIDPRERLAPIMQRKPPTIPAIYVDYEAATG